MSKKNVELLFNSRRLDSPKNFINLMDSFGALVKKFNYNIAIVVDKPNK